MSHLNLPVRGVELLVPLALRDLEKRLGIRSIPLSVWVLGMIPGILLPVSILFCGWAVTLLTDSSPSVETVKNWDDPVYALARTGSPLSVLGALLLAIACAWFLLALSLWGLYRRSSQLSIVYTRQLYQRLFEKSRELARTQSVSGQRAMLGGILQGDMHALRFAWCRKLRSFPRHIVQSISCCVVSLLIDPLSAVLSVIGFGIFRQLYVWTRNRTRRKLPVLAERVQVASQELDESFVDAPLLESVHDRKSAFKGQDDLLRRFVKTHTAFERNEDWQIPTLAWSGILLLVMFAFVISVRVLDPNVGLSLSGAMTLAAAQFALALGCYRLYRAYLILRDAGENAATLNRFLEQPVVTDRSVNSGRLGQIENRVVLEHVTLEDSEGGKLLEDLSAAILPGQINAVLGSSELEARALGELLLGFGRPASGRLLFDNQLSTEIGFEEFSHRCCWIGSNGPLIKGSLHENIIGNSEFSQGDVEEALRAANVLDAVQNLEDGLATMMAPNDDRLNPDHLFRMGVARAILRKPTIVVAAEPNARVGTDIESSTLDALNALVAIGAVVVVLPTRVATLRVARQILVLHKNKLDAVGNHSQLLESSEWYRHLNYIRFSPLMTLPKQV